METKSLGNEIQLEILNIYGYLCVESSASQFQILNVAIRAAHCAINCEKVKESVMYAAAHVYINNISNLIKKAENEKRTKLTSEELCRILINNRMYIFVNQWISY
jgi:hypothetical protein